MIRLYETDHRPLHVHVFKDRVLVARYDLEQKRFMDGDVRHQGRILRALRQVGLIA